MDLYVVVVIAAATGIVGFLLGRAGSRETGKAGSSSELRAAARQEALREAIGRVGGFLEANVRAPLAGAGKRARPGELRERIGRALGALEDLDFYITEPPTDHEAADLTPLVQQVAREFTSDQRVPLRLTMEGGVISASVHPQVLMDALYLVLHNAGRFGGDGTVDLSLGQRDGRAVIRVRDRGEGFSEEAFRRAFDPFYSTSEEGLGLGLPHARKLVEGMGGRIELSNAPDGGAEVEMSFPA
jgi:signal transduction histidine kinase